VGVTAIIPKIAQFLRPSSQLLEYIKPQAFTRDCNSYEVVIGKAIGQAKRNDSLHVKICDKSPIVRALLRSTKLLNNNHFYFA
jgi:hypothetical protein